MEYLFLLVGCVFGFIAGVLVQRLRKGKAIGTLRVNRTDPEGPYLFLELNSLESYEKIEKEKEVTLHVKIKD